MPEDAKIPGAPAGPERAEAGMPAQGAARGRDTVVPSPRRPRTGAAPSNETNVGQSRPSASELSPVVPSFDEFGTPGLAGDAATRAKTVIRSPGGGPGATGTGPGRRGQQSDVGGQSRLPQLPSRHLRISLYRLRRSSAFAGPSLSPSS